MPKKAKKKTPKAGPFIATARAKKMPGKTVRPGGTVVMKEEGEKPIGFKRGGLHVILNVPIDKKIPAAKMQEALAGKHGPLAQKQARFAQNVLKTGRATAQRRKK